MLKTWRESEFHRDVSDRITFVQRSFLMEIIHTKSAVQKLAKAVTVETVEVNTTDKNMKFALVQTIVMLC